MQEKIELNFKNIPGSICYTDSMISASRDGVFFRYNGFCVTRIVSGEAVWQIGGEACSVKNGDFVFLNNLEPRKLVTSSPDFRIETFSFDSAFVSLSSGECLRVFYGRTARYSHVLAEDGTLNVIFSQIKSEFYGQQSPELFLALTIELTIMSARVYDELHTGALEKRFRCDSSAAGAIAESAAYINAHITEELYVPELAKRAGMSTGYYVRSFKKYVFYTPTDYISRCRVRLFKRMMSGGVDMSVIDIAFACGFRSVSGFYKAYKRICGEPPTKLCDDRPVR